MRLFLSLLIAGAVLCDPSAALAPPQTWDLSYTLDDLPDVECDEVWIDASSGGDAEFTFRSMLQDDCDPNACEFSIVPGGADLHGARLEVHYPWIRDSMFFITNVEVTVFDHCGVGCTQVHLFWNDELSASAFNSESNESEIVSVSEGYLPGNRIVVSSCGAEVLGLTVYMMNTAVQESCWGMIRTLY